MLMISIFPPIKIHDPKFSPEKCDDLYFFRIFPPSSTGRYLTPCDIQISVLFVGNEGRKLGGRWDDVMVGCLMRKSIMN